MDYDLRYIIDSYNYDELANAIVLQAVKDIRQALLFEGQTKDNKNLSILLFFDAKKFLHSKFYTSFTDLSGPELFNRIIAEDPAGYQRVYDYVAEKEREKQLHKEALKEAALQAKSVKSSDGTVDIPLIRSIKHTKKKEVQK